MNAVNILSRLSTSSDENTPAKRARSTLWLRWNVRWNIGPPECLPPLQYIPWSVDIPRTDLVGRARLSSTPNGSRVARTLPLSMSILAQSGIEQMRGPDTCLPQLLADGQRVCLPIGSIPDLIRRQRSQSGLSVMPAP